MCLPKSDFACAKSWLVFLEARGQFAQRGWRAREFDRRRQPAIASLLEHHFSVLRMRMLEYLLHIQDWGGWHTCLEQFLRNGDGVQFA